MREKGVALIVTLWVLVLLSVMAMSFSFSTRFGSAATRNFKEDSRAHYLAVSAYEEALAYLLTDAKRQVDFVDGDGNFRTDEDRDPVTGVREVGDAKVELNITDEESRFNINTITPDLLKKLLEYMEVPDSAVQEILDSLADWKDLDDLHHHQGGEDEYYEPLGYRAKDMSLTVPEELLLVKGFEPEYFHGEGEGAGLGQLLTTWGDGFVNINTASPELLEALDLQPENIDSILSNRDAQTPFLRSPIADLPGLRFSTASWNFRIVAKASMKDSPLAVRVTAVVQRNSNPGEPELKTLYWKEDIERSGT